MAALWTDEAKFAHWQEIELAVTEARAARGDVPAAEARACREKARFDVARVHEIERTTHHDVIAFVTNLAENIGPAGRHLHYGLTSSDVVDTAFARQLVAAADVLLADLDALLALLHERALTHRTTICVGRSHGVHAEPTTFGLKLAGWYAAFARRRRRLAAARETVRVGKLSGAVGTYAHLDPELEAEVLAHLGLARDTISTQVIARDRHAEFFTALAETGAVIEQVAVEVRHLQRTEVREAEEAFGKGQKGSSAMPHKRNPILSENLTGLARIVRSSVVPALEDVALWHERDISHSSVERMIAPDATIALDFALHRLHKVIAGLQVHVDRMAQNLGLTEGLIFSQTVLLKLIDKGLTREQAYALVQRNAMRTWDEPGTFKAHLAADAEVAAQLDPDELDACFELEALMERTEQIFERVFPAQVRLDPAAAGGDES